MWGLSFSVKIIQLGIIVTVETGLNPIANGKVEIIYWKDPYAWIFILPVPANNYKKQMEDELTKALNQYLEMFIQMDNKMNHYNKTLIELK